MGIYARFVLPRLVDRTCAMKTSTRQRERVVPKAAGEVLEVGFGTGLSLSCYGPSVRRLWALEPVAENYALSAQRRRAVPFPVEHLACGAEDIPLDDDCVDSVVSAFTLCSVTNAPRALAEIRRVLRPGGRLIYCEHGKAAEARVRRWQQRLTPLWRRVAGGCHLDRDIPALLTEAGFSLQQAQQRFLPGWRPASYHFWGMAE